MTILRQIIESIVLVEASQKQSLVGGIQRAAIYLHASDLLHLIDEASSQSPLPSSVQYLPTGDTAIQFYGVVWLCKVDLGLTVGRPLIRIDTKLNG